MNLSLEKYQNSGSFGTKSKSIIELNDEVYVDGSDFDVTTVSPTEFDLSVILDDTSPKMTGEVLIYSGVVVE